ncbi:uncharacterized protein N7458_011660 [Penicillium daleae]|uniref:Uncharacterized protein n=1 Tax=Penicillium daleae TaxID=63821 RepID=A0AAD6BVI1_9EURO|nr:uncharacterized protein N7458_011660 [Penicillium daleae]KAJ5432504.1 hypothetical protein N7458_011660 [Penicillium daleae]
MSAVSRPISPTVFAEAITELPVESLHAEAAKLQNDINKLLESNAALEAEKAVETEEGIKFLDEVIVENEGVVKSKEERIGLLKAEVEKRGQLWIHPGKKDEEDQDEAQAPAVNGSGHAEHQQEGGRDAEGGVYL